MDSDSLYQKHLSWILAILGSLTADDDLIAGALTTLTIRPPTGSRWNVVSVAHARLTSIDVAQAYGAASTRQIKHYQSVLESVRMWRKRQCTK